MILGLDHVQLAMPEGRESEARHFYCEILGMEEVSKPEELAGRGGAWFQSGGARLHLGIEAGFVPARKAHPALIVENADVVRRRCEESGVELSEAIEIPGHRRFYISDPFGNRLEITERIN